MYLKDGDLDDEIVDALNSNRMKIKDGDLVAKRIQEGMRKDILEKYKDKKTSQFIKQNIKKTILPNLFI